MLRSTWLSAAKLTTASTPAIAWATSVGVGDVAVDEAVAAVVGDVGEVGQVAGVGELVEVHHLRPASERQAHERGADEPAATGHEKLHAVSFR